MADGRDPGMCVHHEAVEQGIAEIKSDTKTILAKLEEGNVTFAHHGLRIGILEKIVYGAAGLLLLGALGLAIRAILNGK
jgi:hypothetical protein